MVSLLHLPGSGLEVQGLGFRVLAFGWLGMKEWIRIVVPI